MLHDGEMFHGVSALAGTAVSQQEKRRAQPNPRHIEESQESMSRAAKVSHSIVWRGGFNPTRFGPIPYLRRFRVFALSVSAAAATCLLLLASGCARMPAGVTGPPPRELILTMTVAGVISPDSFYFLAL